MEDQIAALETEQNLTFDDAFEQSKISWEKDLKMDLASFLINSERLPDYRIVL